MTIGVKAETEVSVGQIVHKSYDFLCAEVIGDVLGDARKVFPMMQQNALASKLIDAVLVICPDMGASGDGIEEVDPEVVGITVVVPDIIKRQRGPYDSFPSRDLPIDSPLVIFAVIQIVEIVWAGLKGMERRKSRSRRQTGEKCKTNKEYDVFHGRFSFDKVFFLGHEYSM